MKKIEVQGSLVFEHHGFYYTVNSDVYDWDPEYVYNSGEYVLKGGALYKARIETPGAWLCNFDRVEPSDRVTATATTDDIAAITTSLDEVRKKLGLDVEEDPIDPGFTHPGCPMPPEEPEVPEEPAPDPNIEALEQRINTIEKTYVRTINNEVPLGGNINIDFDGSVMPPESNIVRWQDSALTLPAGYTINVTDDDSLPIASFDGSLTIGSDTIHVDIKSLDGLTINGSEVVTTDTVVDLINDQNIFGRKHFEKAFTTEAPQEDHQIPNSLWVKEHVKAQVSEAVKPRLNEETTFYIDASNIGDLEDGSREHGFKTLKNAVFYIKKLDLNFEPVTLEFINRYVDMSEMLELPALGSEIKILSRTGLDTELPPLYVTGSWFIDGVTLTDNKLSQCPLEVDRGYCRLGNVKIKLSTPAAGTDAIFVHNNGTVQLSGNTAVSIANESGTEVTRAIHVKAGTLIGNEDRHSNAGDKNSLIISDDNAGFGTGIMATNGARCIYLENTDYECKTLPYVAQKASLIQGLNTRNEGEKDASSIVVS